jgi:hypothetical protein
MAYKMLFLFTKNLFFHMVFCIVGAAAICGNQRDSGVGNAAIAF